MMKAVQLITPGRPLELRDVEIPSLQSDDVLIAVKAAGICHSDAHYRAGALSDEKLPVTLGHEISGVIEEVGTEVTNFNVGDRVCVHYLISCGECEYCLMEKAQFCTSVKMIGNSLNGGYAEYIAVPEKSVFILPEEIPFEPGAIMMCSSATSFHALCKARLKEGETVAVFGIGGLGMAAIQIAKSQGASEVYAVDINKEKLAQAEHFGSIKVDASEVDPVNEILRLTNGKGVNVALELIGLPQTMGQAVRSLAVFGRAAIVGLSNNPMEIETHTDLINKETEIIGISDHLASELPQLIKLVQDGKLNLDSAVSKRIPLDADEINSVLDRLENFGGEAVRTVIIPSL